MTTCSDKSLNKDQKYGSDKMLVDILVVAFKCGYVNFWTLDKLRNPLLFSKISEKRIFYF